MSIREGYVLIVLHGDRHFCSVYRAVSGLTAYSCREYIGNFEIAICTELIEHVLGYHYRVAVRDFRYRYRSIVGDEHFVLFPAVVRIREAEREFVVVCNAVLQRRLRPSFRT